MAEQRLIDAEAFLKTEIDRCGSDPLVGTCTSDNEYLSDRLKKAPIIEAKPVVHGRWEEASDGDGIVCPFCRTDFCTIIYDTEYFNYCPNCGAKMYEKENDNGC